MLQAVRGKEVRVQAGAIGATAAHLAGPCPGHDLVEGEPAPGAEDPTDLGVLFSSPWAGDPSLSFLRPPREVRGLVEAAGFRAVEWWDVTAPSIERWRKRLEVARSRPPLGVHLLLGPRAAEIGENTMRNLAEGRIAVVQAVFDRV